jgi:hypothetical protein
LISAKKKINLSKTGINSHKIHSEIECWKILKIPWDEIICHIYDTKRVEDEKYFLLDCTAYTLSRRGMDISSLKHFLISLG